jgi:hypothetical protein
MGANCRCVICDCSAIARRGDVEPAIATAMMVALAGIRLMPPSGDAAFDRLDTLKASLCEEHRRGWALLLLRGGMGLDAVAEGCAP